MNDASGSLSSRRDSKWCIEKSKFWLKLLRKYDQTLKKKLKDKTEFKITRKKLKVENA